VLQNAGTFLKSRSHLACTPFRKGGWEPIETFQTGISYSFARKNKHLWLAGNKYVILHAASNNLLLFSKGYLLPF
jgi:hypothetical protein